jgi:hypothetical protein
MATKRAPQAFAAVSRQGEFSIAIIGAVMFVPLPGNLDLADRGEGRLTPRSPVTQRRRRTFFPWRPKKEAAIPRAQDQKSSVPPSSASLRVFRHPMAQAP